MKEIYLLAIGVILSITLTNAQDETDPCWGETPAQVIRCQEAVSIWQGDRQQTQGKDYATEYASWLEVRKVCPECAQETVYSIGAKYYSQFIKENKGDSITQQLYVDSLLEIYTLSMSNLKNVVRRSWWIIFENG